jgi:hypothetical protein
MEETDTTGTDQYVDYGSGDIVVAEMIGGLRISGLADWNPVIIRQSVIRKSDNRLRREIKLVSTKYKNIFAGL